MRKEGRKKLDSFLRLFCVGIVCTAILAVGTFALVGSGIFDGVVNGGNSSKGNGKTEITETGAGENKPNPTPNPNNNFDYKFIEIDGEWFVDEIGEDAIDENGKIVLPDKTPDGDKVIGVVGGLVESDKEVNEIYIPEGYKEIADDAFNNAKPVKRIVVDSKDIYNGLDENLFGLGGDNRKNVEILVNTKVDDGSNTMLNDTDFYLVEEENLNNNSYNRYFFNTTDYKIVKGVVLGFTSAGSAKQLSTIDLNKEFTSGIKVVAIGASAFAGNTSAKSLKMGEGIQTIGEFAFYNSAIESIESTNEQSELLIDRCAFMNANVKTAKFGVVRKINMYAFKNCELSGEFTLKNVNYWNYFVAQQSYAGTIKIQKYAGAPAGGYAPNKKGDVIYVRDLEEFMQMNAIYKILNSASTAQITKTSDSITITDSYIAMGNYQISGKSYLFENGIASELKAHPEREYGAVDINSFVKVSGDKIEGVKENSESMLLALADSFPNYARELYVGANINTINLDVFLMTANKEMVFNRVRFELEEGQSVVFRYENGASDVGDVELTFDSNSSKNALKIESLLFVLSINNYTGGRLVRVK